MVREACLKTIPVSFSCNKLHDERNLMKILIASDIHGSAYWTKRLIKAVEQLQPDKIVLLGDLLYHGPRNDLPKEYDPKQVTALLNDLAETGKVLAVRGNCDAEVDQMVLDFPCMADYVQLVDDKGRTLFLTHGHIYGVGLHGSSANMPSLSKDSVFIYGHTHIKVNASYGALIQESEAGKERITSESKADKEGVNSEPKASKEPATSASHLATFSLNQSDLWIFNPGSVSLPKDGSNSVGIYDSAKPINDAFSYLYLEDL